MEQVLVNTDPFDGNKCTDEKCEPNKNPANKINCRRNSVCYRVTCRLCLAAGRAADVTHLECACYYGQTGKNMHCRSKEHVSKFNSKSEKIRSESAFHIYCRIMHKNANNVKLRGIVLLDSRYVVIWELLSFKIVPLPHNHQSVWKPLR